jgi:hypothetical protein
VPSRREQRQVEFRRLISGDYSCVSFHPALLHCAITVLQIALKDHRGKMTDFRESSRKSTYNALGAPLDQRVVEEVH